MKPAVKKKRDTAFVIARRTAYKTSLSQDIEMLERTGCTDSNVANMRTRLACIEWLEANSDPRPLDSETMAEFEKTKTGSETI